MQLTTTFKLLRKAGACKSRYEFLRKALPRPSDLQTEDEGEFCDGCGEQHGYHDDTPINLLTILEINGLDDALWALCATTENCDKVARLMGADFAEQVLSIWQKYSQDKSPELAIKAARDFANGAIIDHERDAAGAAAWDAAREKQREIFVSYLQPDAINA